MDETCTCYKESNFTKDRENLFYLKDGACVAMGTMNTAAMSLFSNDNTYTKLKSTCGIIDIDANEMKNQTLIPKIYFFYGFRTQDLNGVRKQQKANQAKKKDCKTGININ